MIERRVVVSQEFPNAGRWIVHLPGANRPHKLAYFATEAEARECADRVNHLLEEVLADSEKRE